MTTSTDPRPRRAAADCPAPLSTHRLGIVFERPQAPDLHIVDDLDLTVRSGTIVCLAGRSGSGKTSLLRCCAGLLRPTSGTVEWSGREITSMSPSALAIARRSALGYVDQSNPCLDGLSLLENVLLPAVPFTRGASGRRERPRFRERAMALLADVGLDAQADHDAAVASGGERQRTVIARALLTEPAALAVDEPTASLDRASADRVIDALRTAAAKGTAILVTSHDHAVIEAADSVLALD
ncbi:ABC transporter ATP-binding protein [Acidipropionibacterium timonense]|uniref:ABC transporter ATP-binding protein n=1 Tax=Acidipropionibacterium timonense TaxID=2161818 RepID=UPI001436AEA6|nr:ATP-binding cassette domain-containing protein [Acidipropionibacterium timonense]